jgi:hypothetical protein
MLRGIGKALRCSLGCRRLARSPFSRAQAENCEAGTGLAFLLASLVCTTSNVLQIFFQLKMSGSASKKKKPAQTMVRGVAWLLLGCCCCCLLLYWRKECARLSWAGGQWSSI